MTKMGRAGNIIFHKKCRTVALSFLSHIWISFWFEVKILRNFLRSLKRVGPVGGGEGAAGKELLEAQG